MSNKYVNNNGPMLIKPLERFFQDIGEHSKTKGDLIAGYNHQRLQPNETYLPVIERSHDETLQITYRMRYADFHGKNTDGQIPLDSNDPEYVGVIGDIMKIYNYDEPSAKQMLEMLDPKDNLQDRQINYLKIEKLLLEEMQGGAPLFDEYEDLVWRYGVDPY